MGAAVPLVPPFATGRVPLTWVVRPTFPQLGVVPEIRTLPAAAAINDARVPVPEAYRMSPTAYVVMLVPPLATGKVPVTPSVSEICW